MYAFRLYLVFFLCTLSFGQGRVGREQSSTSSEHPMIQMIWGMQDQLKESAANIRSLIAANQEMKQQMEKMKVTADLRAVENQEIKQKYDAVEKANSLLANRVSLVEEQVKVMKNEMNLLKATNAEMKQHFEEMMQITQFLVDRVPFIEPQLKTSLQAKPTMASQPTSPTSSDCVTQTEFEQYKKRLACVDPASGQDNLIFSGCNVHVRNGLNLTDSKNGKGNLILGYNEGGATLQTNRTGSHNIVVGPTHQYTSVGSIISGEANFVSGKYSGCIGGFTNKVNGDYSVALSGYYNTLNGLYSVTIAGTQNRASGLKNVIVGGTFNLEDGSDNVVVGGALNRIDSSINFGVQVGGLNNSVIGDTDVMIANTLFKRGL